MMYTTRRVFLGVFSATPLAAILPDVVFGQDVDSSVSPAGPAGEGRQAEVSKGLRAIDGETLGPRAFIKSPVLVRVKSGENLNRYTVQDVSMDECGRLIDCAGGDKKNGVYSIRNLTVARVRSVNARAEGLIRLRGPSSDIVIRDVFFQSAAVNERKGKVYAVIQLQGKSDLDVGKRILIERVYGEGIQSSYEGFKNGDIFADESGWSEVIYRQCHGKSASDSIFDLKSNNTLLDRCIAEKGRRNFKLWYDKHSTRLTSINPGQKGNGVAAHYFAKGSPTRLCTQVIEHIDFISDNKTPLFVAEDNPVNIVVKGYTCNVPPGTPVVGGKASLARITWETGAPKL